MIALKGAPMGFLVTQKATNVYKNVLYYILQRIQLIIGANNSVLLTHLGY
jgi:hypothetical protein